MSEVFPWFAESLQQLAVAQQADRLPHACMIVADNQCGKKQFAYQLVNRLFCQQTADLQQESCASCKSCRLLQAGTHPDFFLLDCLTDNKGKQKISIGIDQVRELTEQLSEMSLLGGYKVCLISSVSALTQAAFNALLKTLEEPTSNTLMLLLSDNLQRVPATIKSRCQLLRPQLNQQTLLPWLMEQSQASAELVEQALDKCCYAPLKALSYIQQQQHKIDTQFFQRCDDLLLNKLDPYEFFEDLDLDWWQIFKLLISYFYLVQNCILQGNGLAQYQQIPAKLVFKLYDELLQFNRAQIAGSNLQPQLQLREILIKWFEVGRKILYFSKA